MASTPAIWVAPSSARATSQTPTRPKCNMATVNEEPHRTIKQNVGLTNSRRGGIAGECSEGTHPAPSNHRLEAVRTKKTRAGARVAPRGPRVGPAGEEATRASSVDPPALITAPHE